MVNDPDDLFCDMKGKFMGKYIQQLKTLTSDTSPYIRVKVVGAGVGLYREADNNWLDYVLTNVR